MGKKLSRGKRAIRWIETHCRVPEGRHVGEPLKLRGWQKAVIRGIYDTPTRTAIISFGRKNGKTALAACLLLLHLVGVEALQNSQLCSAAQSKDQAAVLYKLAAKMVRLNPVLDAFVVCRDNTKELFVPRIGTLYAALSAEVKTKHGLSPAFIVHDELGQVRGARSELYETLETGTGAHEHPLSVVISTQAPTDSDLLSILIDDAKTGADPTVKVFLWTADEDLDPFSVKAMRAANPAYGDFLNAAEVRKGAENARRMPSREAGYRNLQLNQRCNQSSPFVPRRLWTACRAAALPLSALRPSYAGLDLSARNDMTATVIVRQADDGIWDVYPFFFAPQLGLIDRAKRDRAPYDVWARKGFLILTPGASVDYDFVAAHLVEQCDGIDMRAIAYDRWRIDVFKAALQRLSRELPMVEFGQGFKDMSPALDELEADLADAKLRHGGHPILTWNAANAVATKDPAGNRKLDKSKATGRIDGLVALAMARGAAAKSLETDKPLVLPAGYSVTVV